MYQGDPEALHAIKNETDKKSADAFVNQGTPAAALAGMSDRKTGQVSGAGSETLKARLQPSVSETPSYSNTTGNDGVLPTGK